MSKAVDLTGLRFGKLVAVRNTGEKRVRSFVWKCLCDCGGVKLATSGDLKPGKVKSCGCLQKISPNNLSHGHARKRLVTGTYRSWQMMHRRCLGYSAVHKERYTDRGITVCERWNSFDNFLADMGERPQGLTLDRINSSGNYEPTNCRWATKHQQAANRGNSVFITFKGRTLCAAEWARETGLCAATIQLRVKKNLTAEKILSTEKYKRSQA